MERRWDKSKPPRGPFALNRDCPQAQGLVAWYPMGGPSGKGQAFDLAGKYHLSGTVGATTLGVDGQPAQSFTAVSSHGIGVVSLPVSTFPLSIVAWCRPATTHSGNIAGLASNTGAAGYGRKLLFCTSDGTVKGYSQDDTAGELKASATGTYTAGQWMHAATVFAASNDNRTYRNGANKGTSSTNRGWGTLADRTRIGDDNSGGNYFNGDIGECGIWNVVLDDSLIWRLYDPGTRFELWYPLRSKKWFTQVGGTTHNVSVNEAAAASDTVSAILATAASLTETMSLTDTAAALLAGVASVAESLTTTDTASAVIVLPVDLVETASLTDSQTAALLLSAIAAETLTLADTQTAIAALSAVVQETLSVADVVACIATALASLTETVSLTDLASTEPITTASLEETISLADTTSATAARVAAVTEALTLLDSLVGTSLRPASLAETLSLVDQVVASLGGVTSPLERVLLRSRITQAILERSRVSFELKLRSKLRH